MKPTLRSNNSRTKFILESPILNTKLHGQFQISVISDPSEFPFGPRSNSFIKLLFQAIKTTQQFAKIEILWVDTSKNVILALLLREIRHFQDVYIYIKFSKWHLDSVPRPNNTNSCTATTNISSKGNNFQEMFLTLSLNKIKKVRVRVSARTILIPKLLDFAQSLLVISC